MLRSRKYGCKFDISHEHAILPRSELITFYAVKLPATAGRLMPDDMAVAVSVNDRSLHGLVKRFDRNESQLTRFSNPFVAEAHPTGRSKL
jgi:hypothetical protein